VQGVVPRDLKPPNILLQRRAGRQVAKIGDYGLAKAFQTAGMTKGQITRPAGGFAGSLHYMAREHVTEYKYLKPVTDVFELAATFFHMLTGRTVWPPAPQDRMLKVILERSPLRLRDHFEGAPQKLYQAMDKALALEPTQRFQDGAEFLQAMREALGQFVR
jgi:eukaryotic-like serine/threonine-protein kinase